MKRLITLVFLQSLIMVGAVHAQTLPGKDLAAVKTDPVLRPIPSLNTEPTLNIQPVMELITLLESKGAKVEARLNESKELTSLNLKVDGKAIKPIIVECRDCVIVFEY